MFDFICYNNNKSKWNHNKKLILFVLKLKTMLDLFHICASVQQIAREAGLFLKQEREAFAPEKIEEKGLHNYVSYVDKSSEKMLIENLGALFTGL